MDNIIYSESFLFGRGGGLGLVEQPTVKTVSGSVRRNCKTYNISEPLFYYKKTHPVFKAEPHLSDISWCVDNKLMVGSGVSYSTGKLHLFTWAWLMGVSSFLADTSWAVCVTLSAFSLLLFFSILFVALVAKQMMDVGSVLLCCGGNH